MEENGTMNVTTTANEGGKKNVFAKGFDGLKTGAKGFKDAPKETKIIGAVLTIGAAAASFAFGYSTGKKSKGTYEKKSSVTAPQQ